ncbi:MAG: PAS domain-containing protein, partial [Thermodesulfobacteriota bacterium]
MRDESKTKKQLISELAELRLKLSQYEESDDELSRRTDELTLTFQSIGDGVVIASGDRKIMLMNAKAGELTGWSPEEAVGRELEDVLRLYKKDDGDRQSPIEPAKEVLETGEKLGLPRDTILFKRDGSTRFISASFAPLSNERTEFRGVVVVFRDITRIRQAEEALTESEKKYRTLVENSYDLIYEVDSTGRILYVNPVCTELTGYDRSELLGKAAFDFIHPEDRPNAMSVFMRAVSNLSTERVTFRALNKAGEYQWLECVGKPFIATNREKRGVIITRNITDRKKAEEELLALNTLMKAVHSFLDLNEVYNVALDIVMRMENVDMAIIYLVDRGKERSGNPGVEKRAGILHSESGK